MRRGLGTGSAWAITSDGPGFWIDSEKPSVEQGVQVASQEQAALEVMFGVVTVEVKIGLECSGWLRAGKGAGFTEAGEHGLAESLLAKSRLTQSQHVASRNPHRPHRNCVSHQGSPVTRWASKNRAELAYIQVGG